jgi:hypothetical protein
MHAFTRRQSIKQTMEDKMFFVSMEDQKKVHKRYSDIREIAEDFYLEYFNNYQTISKIAEHYEVNRELAVELIKLGKGAK